MTGTSIAPAAGGSEPDESPTFHHLTHIATPESSGITSILQIREWRLQEVD